MNGVFGQQGGPLLPTFAQCWPVTPKYRQMHSSSGTIKRAGGFPSIRPSHAISGVDVYQGAEHIVIGGAKVSHQFLRIQRTSSVNQSSASPSGVIRWSRSMSAVIAIGMQVYIWIRFQVDFGFPFPEVVEGRCHRRTPPKRFRCLWAIALSFLQLSLLSPSSPSVLLRLPPSSSLWG